MAALRLVSIAWLGVIGAALVGGVAALPGCDEATDEKTTKVTILDKTFTLELALDEDTRFKGLSDRTEIAADGGMLFVFPDSQARVQEFVMRRCPIAIDIIYLDKTGRVVQTHRMTPEDPQKEGESEDAYNARLKRYSSRYSSQFVIELKGDTLDEVKVKNGLRIKIDEDVKKRAR